MSDDEYEIPLQDQRIFGAGLKRKRVHFVPSTTSTTLNSTVPTSESTTSIGDRYLSLVLSKSADSGFLTSSLPTISHASKKQVSDATLPAPQCEICSLPLPSTSDVSRPHEASLAHQVCLEHSHPPSHLDRSRLGLRYLQSQGWDPDSRKGLGAQGQGIQFPIKAKPKDDKTGLGLLYPGEKSNKALALVKRETREGLDAGKVRKLEERDRQRRQKLQELFYRDEDINRYLRTD